MTWGRLVSTTHGKTPAQTPVSDAGNAETNYDYDLDFLPAVIRECFPTSILLGSITSPVQPRPTCTPEPVESDSIQVD